MKIQNYPVTKIKISSIRCNPIQPMGRETDTALASLRNAVNITGLIVPVIVVQNADGTYTMLDGHRRMAVALEAGEKHLQAMVVVMDPETGLLRFGTTTRLIGTQDCFNSWAKAPDPTNYLEKLTKEKKAVASNIRSAIRLLGECDAKRRALQGHALTFVSRTYTVYGFLNQWGENGSVTELVTSREIANWILDHKMCSVIGGVKQLGSRRIAVKLRQAILKNVPFELPKHRKGPNNAPPI